MSKLFTLSTLAALAAASLSAQAQIKVDGTLSPAEIGTGAGKYQLVSTYTGVHSVADHGLKALYMGTTATTLNVMVVASPEQKDYSHIVLYMDLPGKTGGIPAGTALPGTDPKAVTPLNQNPTLDIPSTDLGVRLTVSPLNNANNAIYLTRLDYTKAKVNGNYAETGMGSTKKDGSVATDANDPGKAQTAFQTSSSVAANTNTGWEFSILLSDLGGAANGDIFNVMVGYVDDLNPGHTFYSDLLPQIVGQTTNIGLNPNFVTIPGKQYLAYQVGAGVLATRAASATLQASAYPNPVAADSRLDYVVAGTAQPVTVTAYNSLGQPALTLLSGATQPAGAHSLALAPLQRLAAGMYLLQVRAGDQLSTQRVVVQ